MKKIIAAILTAMMLCAACGAPAEENKPMFATLGDALDATDEAERIAGGEEGYYAVITEKDGKYYRSVGTMDEKAKALYDAIPNAEDIEGAFAAADEYMRTLPVDYTEEFTAEPMAQADLDALAGKTLAELEETGFETVTNGMEAGETEDEVIIVYTMRNGLFDYDCTVDADPDAYEKAQENGTENELVVKSAKVKGLTREAFMKRFHTDGTVDPMEDPFETFNGFLGEMGEILAAHVSEDGTIDAAGLAEDLKKLYPEQADQIDAALQMYTLLGPALMQQAEQ